MDWSINKKTIRNIFIIMCAGVVLYWLLHETERVKVFTDIISGLLSPFVFGGVIAFILNVPMRAYETKLLKNIKNEKFKRLLAVVLTLLSVVLVLTLVFCLLIPQVLDTVNVLLPELYDFFSDTETFVDTFLGNHPKLESWLTNNTDFENFSWQSLLQKNISLVGNGISTIIGGAVSAVGSIFTGLFNFFIGFVFSIYCLFQKEVLSRQGRKLIYAFLKESTADSIVRVLRLTNATFSNFLSGQCLEVAILGSMFAVTMAIFRMPYVPLISVLIAVTAFIPYIGAWTGCIFGGFLILVEDPVLAFWFVVLFILLQNIENNLIYPKVVGDSVGLAGMWVLVAITIGGKLMGIIGMFLFIPVVSVLYTLLQEKTNKKLESMDIDPDKLVPHPPELNSKRKEKRIANKQKRKMRWMNKKVSKTK